MAKQKGASRFFGASNDDADSSDDEVEIVLVIEPERRTQVAASNDSISAPKLATPALADGEQVVPAASDNVEQVPGQEWSTQEMNKDLKQRAFSDDIDAKETAVHRQIVHVEEDNSDDGVRDVDVDTNADGCQNTIIKPSDSLVKVEGVVKAAAEDGSIAEVATKNKNQTTQNESEKENQEAEKDSTVEQNELQIKANPFAQFAFGSSTPMSATASRTSATGATSKNVRSRNWILTAKKEPAPAKKKTKTDKKEWIPLAELSLEEQQRVLRKWQGLSFDSFSLEDRRFQVMVASRLHARCQETVVRKCMTVLREAGVLTCSAMAGVDPEVLASLLTSLQYYNTKSKHLVQSSKQLLQDFGGMVPELKDDLLKLTGIGPVMADLLSNINTREAYQQAA